MDKKYINNFHSNAPKNIPNLGVFVHKYTIWQPWLRIRQLKEEKHELRFGEKIHRWRKSETKLLGRTKAKGSRI
jgi:hypothetical protein